MRRASNRIKTQTPTLFDEVMKIDEKLAHMMLNRLILTPTTHLKWIAGFISFSCRFISPS